MARKSSKRRPLRKIRVTNAVCSFCKQAANPDYKNFSDLARYLTDRGRILGRARTGVCAKHQRKLAVSIKRARHLGLLSFTGGL